MSDEPLPEHVLVNRAHWDGDAANRVAGGEREWRSEPTWAMACRCRGCCPTTCPGWMPSSSLRHRLRVGVDGAPWGRGGRHRQPEAQLATARRLADEHGIELTLIHATPNPFRIPTPHSTSQLGVRRGDLVRPVHLDPEAHRLLRPGGTLAFLGSSTLAMLCSPLDGSLPVTERLERDYFSIHRLDWRDAVDEPGGIEFNLPTSKWFRLFDDTGFDVVDFIEIQALQPTKPTRFASSSLPSGPTATRPNRSGCSASGDHRASIVRGTTG